MERLKDNSISLQILGSLVMRSMMATSMGYQYGTDRDLYQALGYPITLKFSDYFGKYIRHDIAKAIIDRPVKASWQGALELIEPENADKTKFEKAWKDLNIKFGLKSVLARVDKLTGIGRYGILLLGLDDVKNPEDFKLPVKSGKRTLVYVKPFSEEGAKITEWDINPKSDRYGLPKIYTLQVSLTDGGTTTSISVHYTRVIHVIDDPLESDVYGTPRLEVVYNRLMDIEKLVGGDAEMFWRGARPGYQGKVDKDFQMTEATKKDLKEQIDEFEHNINRFLVNEGVDLAALAPQVSDPSSHFDVQMKCISSVTGIPMRVLTGSERGQLASSEDKGEWLTFVQYRREEHIEPRIIRPTVDRLIELQILPTPEDGYMIDWSDLFSISEKERVDIGKGRATALREYLTALNATEVIPPKAFMEFFLGLTTQQIELINKMVEKGETTENAIMKAITSKDNLGVAPIN